VVGKREWARGQRQEKDKREGNMEGQGQRKDGKEEWGGWRE